MVNLKLIFDKINYIESCATEVEKFLDANGIALDKKNETKRD